MLFAGTYVLMAGSLLMAQPKDNPVGTFYGTNHDYPAWTEEVKWNNVISMSD